MHDTTPPINGFIDEQSNALEALFQYYIQESTGDPIPFSKHVFIPLSLELLGGSAGIYSWPPATKYAQDTTPWIKYSLIITNPLSNVLFLLKATDDFFNTLAIEFTIPHPLKAILTRTHKTELRRKYLKILVGSAICAIPFGVTTYLFPLPHCETTACLSAIIVHSWISN